jgi:hypothetical protein
VAFVARGVLVTLCSIGPEVVLFMLPFAVAMILLAVKIWQSAARPAAMASPEQAHHADQLAGTGKGIARPVRL